MKKPLLDRDFVLQKFPGKGGWTYAAIPEIAQNPKAPFGWVKVRGSIDDYELTQYKLMPMGNGKLFLPVKAAIRKKIGKQAGDTVRIILSIEERPLETPQEILDCFDNEPSEAFETFQGFSESEQKVYLDWIYNTKKEETKADRIATMMERLLRGLKYYDKD